MPENPELVPRPPGRVDRPQGPVPEPRTAEQIRSDIQRQREELGSSVEALRGRVTELTDWRRHVREHKRELAIGAAVVGFAVGGLMALRRR